MAFTGIPRSALHFLSELAKHNDKEWFDAHRAAWDGELVPAMLGFCEALAGRLRKEMPNLQFVPRIGGSLYRLNRDTRFSRDKRPYKTHSAALLWEGGHKHESPGVYLQVSPDEVIFGGGLYVFEEGRLDRYRKLCAQEKSGARLLEAIAFAAQAGLSVEGEKLARPARGIGPDHPLAELSRHKGLVVAKVQKAGAWLHGPEALDRAEAVARAYLPLHTWLRDELCKS